MFLISDAMAESSAGPLGGGFEIFIMIGIFFAIMYFMIIRPQQKRSKDHQKLIGSLSKGDEVVTSGGMLGKILKIGDNSITLEISEGVAIKLQKHSISSVLPKGTLRNE
ncbi:MAG: preprotein translocase subunit YajC [Gammaproteobacteria bacterium]|nr:preprotein translocase subunit YajC [Gammaproteobacteria bacterium]